MKRLSVLLFIGLVGALASACEPGPGAAAQGPPPATSAVVTMVAADGPATTAPAAGRGFRVDFLDVGQGDAILVTANGHRLLIDGGPSQELLRGRMAEHGVDDLDAILVTNPDADHIRGLTEALALFPIETVYQTASSNTTLAYEFLQEAIAAEPGVTVLAPMRGDVIALGDLRLRVLHPDILTGDRNQDSVVLQLTCGTVDVLLMGDATAASEESMLAAGLITDVDVVKAGHHGSDTSSSARFIAAARPEYVVYSAARFNPYGHPHREVVARYAAAGADAVYTDTSPEDDTATLTSDCATYRWG